MLLIEMIAHLGLTGAFKPELTQDELTGAFRLEGTRACEAHPR